MTPQRNHLQTFSVLIWILQIWILSIWGEQLWAILSTYPKPMPIRHNSAVFPKFFITNKTVGLPHLPYDPLWAPLGENRSLTERGSLCFQFEEDGGCINLVSQALAMFDSHQGGWLRVTQNFRNSDITVTSKTFWQKAIWINGTFVSPGATCKECPPQPRIAPHCSLNTVENLPPWSDCQSSLTGWANQDKTFSFSPNMRPNPEGKWDMKQGMFTQDYGTHPFHKWLLCGINGSCTDLSPLVFIQGGTTGEALFNGISKFYQYHKIVTPGLDGTSNMHVNSTTEITRVNKTQKQVDFLPIPVCVYPSFLFILSNSSFESCTNDSCIMSQCWAAEQARRAMIARVPQWIPVPVETPSTLSLFRQKRDFGITAAIITAISISAVAATTAGIAMSTTVQTGATLNQLSTTVADAADLHTSASAQLKGGLMVVNQRIDLVEERLDILILLAQLGCERKLGALCITSVQYDNYTRAANLSRKLSLYLAGRWSEGFEETLESLRMAVITINSTRVDLSLTEGLSSWVSSAFSFFKEWVGVGMFGTILCGGLVLVLWLFCRLKNQHTRDKVVTAQALMAIEQGSSPRVWLSMLNE